MPKRKWKLEVAASQTWCEYEIEGESAYIALTSGLEYWRRENQLKHSFGDIIEVHLTEQV